MLQCDGLLIHEGDVIEVVACKQAHVGAQALQRRNFEREIERPGCETRK